MFKTQEKGDYYFYYLCIYFYVYIQIIIEVYTENVLSNVLSMLPQLQHVQNRAIPKPPFNRVFQGGTGRGTNGSIQ